MNTGRFRDPDARIPLGRLMAYCSLTFPIVAVGMPVTTFLPPLYAGSGQLGLAVVGTIFMLARIWDVISDPIVGVLVDRYHWRFGPRKAWILLSIPILCITAYFLYMPQEGEAASAPLLLFQLILLYTGWTLLQTAHQAWGADLTPDYDERSRLFGAREMVNVFGSIFILALPALFGLWIVVGEFVEVAIMGWFLIVMLPVTALIAFLFVPDRLNTKTKDSSDAISLKTILSSLKEKTLWQLLFIEIAIGIGVGVTSATFVFVARGVVGFDGAVSMILLVYFVAAIVGVPIWLALSRRLEKHTSLQIACLYSLVGTLLQIPVILYGSQALFVVFVALLGLGFGGPQALLRAMMADQVDREEVRSGQNKAGFYFAFMNTSYKVGQAAAVAIAFFLLAIIGFDPEVPENKDYHLGLVMVFSLVPAMTFALSAWLCHRYPLDRKRHEMLSNKLKETRPVEL